MTPQELYALWAPIWEKCPELRPLHTIGALEWCQDNYYADKIINWTALEWLWSKGCVPCLPKRHRHEQIRIMALPPDGHDDNELKDYFGETLTEALAAACLEVVDLPTPICSPETHVVD